MLFVLDCVVLKKNQSVITEKNVYFLSSGWNTLNISVPFDCCNPIDTPLLFFRFSDLTRDESGPIGVTQYTCI